MIDHARTLTVRIGLGAALLISIGSVAGADTFFAENGSIIGNLCIGEACTANELFSIDTLRLKDQNIVLHFSDTSPPATGDSSNDWRININAPGIFGQEFFAIEDSTAGNVPFRIDAGAGPAALHINDQGFIGMGTTLPQVDLHIADTLDARIRLDTTGPAGARTWDVVSGPTGYFSINNIDNVAVPFSLAPDAPTNSITANSNGFVGLGTFTPTEKLHVYTSASDTDAFALFEAAGMGSDAAFLLRQNGTIPSTWEFRNQQSSGRLNVGLAGGNTPFKIDNAANNNLLRLGRNGLPGEVNITGTLVVNNTQLNVPDYVFDEDYALRPLAEVQAFIDENSHLPDVPSEAEIKANGVDMTAMQMTLLKKVEELTLYTLEQESRLADQSREIAQLRALFQDRK